MVERFDEQIIKWNLYKFDEQYLGKSPNYIFLLKGFLHLYAWKKCRGENIIGVRTFNKLYILLKKIVASQYIYNKIPSIINPVEIEHATNKAMQVIYANINFDFNTLHEKRSIPRLAMNKSFAGYDIEELANKGIEW